MLNRWWSQPETHPAWQMAQCGADGSVMQCTHVIFQQSFTRFVLMHVPTLKSGKRGEYIVIKEPVNRSAHCLQCNQCMILTQLKDNCRLLVFLITITFSIFQLTNWHNYTSYNPHSRINSVQCLHDLICFYVSLLSKEDSLHLKNHFSCKGNLFMHPLVFI